MAINRGRLDKEGEGELRKQVQVLVVNCSHYYLVKAPLLDVANSEDVARSSKLAAIGIAVADDNRLPGW